MDNNVHLPLTLNSNLSFIESRGTSRIYRVLGFNDTLVCLIEIGALRMKMSCGVATNDFKRKTLRKTVGSRVHWPRNRVDLLLQQGKLERVSELGIPAEMVAFRPSTTDFAFSLRRKAVAYVANYSNDVLFNSRVYSEAVKLAADRCDTTPRNVRKWFETELFFGRHPNAQMVRNYERGAPGVSRRNKRTVTGRPVPMGRKTNSERLFSNSKLKRQRLTAPMLAEYKSFLAKEAWLNNDPFYLVHRRFIIHRIESIVASDRNPDSSKYRFPDTENARAIGRKILKNHRYERDISGNNAYGSKRQLSGGSAQDIVDEYLSVLDIDGTTADNYILFGDDVMEIDGVAKPTVLLTVCRSSDAITGWYVGYGAENGDAYLHAVFSAYTDKTRELIRWKVPHLSGMVFGCSNQIFIDRGPGISRRIQEAIAERLRTHSLIALPGDAQGKGHAEQVMHQFQKELSILPGSYFKTGDPDVDRRRRLNAKNGAISLERFMEALLKAINHRNLNADVRHLLTPEMLKHKVPACPAAIYQFNKSRRYGDSAWDWTSEEIFMKLCEKTDRVVDNGHVTLKNLQFSSSELKAFSRHHEAIETGPCSITVYLIPNVPFLLFWKLPNNGLGLLEVTEANKKTYEEGLTFSIEYQNYLRNHLLATARSNQLREQVKDVTRKIQSTVSDATQRRIDAVEKNSVIISMAYPETEPSPKKRAQKKQEIKTFESIISEFSNPVVDTSQTRLVSENPVYVDDGSDEEVFIDY